MKIIIDSEQLQKLNLSISEYIILYMLKEGLIEISPGLTIVVKDPENQVFLPNNALRAVYDLEQKDLLNRNPLVELKDPLIEEFKEIFYMYPETSGHRRLRPKEFDENGFQCGKLFNRYKKKPAYEEIKRGIVNYLAAMKRDGIMNMLYQMPRFFDEYIWETYKDGTPPFKPGLRL